MQINHKSMTLMKVVDKDCGKSSKGEVFHYSDSFRIRPIPYF